jgi:thioester reductase-like protein
MEGRRLNTSRACHSTVMEAILDPFTDTIRQVNLHPPKIPFISNVTGTWITTEQATTPSYYVRHLRSCVRFADGIKRFFDHSDQILLEVGPGDTLSTLTKQHPAKSAQHVILTSIGHPRQEDSDAAFLLTTLGRLWLAGAEVDWKQYYSSQNCRRILLPTYPFERKRYWIDPPTKQPLVDVDLQQSWQTSADEGLAHTLGGIMDQSVKKTTAEQLERPELSQAYQAPQSRIEQKIAKIWQEILGMKKIGVHDDFFELCGGDSLIAAQLINKINMNFSSKLPVKILFDCPNVVTLAQKIEDSFQTENGLIKTFSDENPDLGIEAILEPSLQFDQPSEEAIDDPKAILLTGATGFIGPYLLAELLDKTHADIYCLVRSSSQEDAEKRLIGKMKIYFLWKDHFGHRIVPLSGDLSLPLWGLQGKQYEALADTIQIVYHNGAWVNFLYPYSTLKRTNVFSTQEILRFAGHRQTKPVHFTSTIGVFSSAYTAVFETDISKKPYKSGYGQSKWVAEHLIHIAKERGLPACVYRLGQVTPHSRTGIMDNAHDFFSSLIMGCVQSKISPFIDKTDTIKIMPVDYVSQSMIYLSQQKGLLGKNFHFLNPQSVYWKNIMDDIRAFGYKITDIAPQEWVRRINDLILQGQKNALAPFASNLSGVLNELKSSSNRFHTKQTQEALKDAGIVCPTVDYQLISNYLSFFVHKKKLPPPTNQ